MQFKEIENRLVALLGHPEEELLIEFCPNRSEYLNVQDGVETFYENYWVSEQDMLEAIVDNKMWRMSLANDNQILFQAHALNLANLLKDILVLDKSGQKFLLDLDNNLQALVKEQGSLSLSLGKSIISYEDNHWVSDSEKVNAKKNGFAWEIQVYPDTPSGFYFYAASNLDKLMEHIDVLPDTEYKNSFKIR